MTPVPQGPGLGETHRVRIDVHVLVFFISVLESFPNNRPREYFPQLGQSLTLSCTRPASFPEPEVFWAVVVADQSYTPVSLSDRISIDPEGMFAFLSI